MYHRRKRDPAVTEALAEHRKREDAAPRLRDEAPKLESLRLTFEDVQDEGRTAVPSYTRPIVVASAPAHFEVRCMEQKCDGRHDLTSQILRGLKDGKPSFSGQSSCNGMVADVSCNRTLSYTCEATYRK